MDSPVLRGQGQVRAMRAQAHPSRDRHAARRQHVTNRASASVANDCSVDWGGFRAPADQFPRLPTRWSRPDPVGLARRLLDRFIRERIRSAIGLGSLAGVSWGRFSVRSLRVAAYPVVTLGGGRRLQLPVWVQDDRLVSALPADRREVSQTPSPSEVLARTQHAPVRAFPVYTLSSSPHG